MADSGTVDLVDEDDDEFEKDMKEAIAASLIMQGRLSARHSMDMTAEDEIDKALALSMHTFEAEQQHREEEQPTVGLPVLLPSQQMQQPLCAEHQLAGYRKRNNNASAANLAAAEQGQAAAGPNKRQRNSCSPASASNQVSQCGECNPEEDYQDTSSSRQQQNLQLQQQQQQQQQQLEGQHLLPVKLSGDSELAAAAAILLVTLSQSPSLQAAAHQGQQAAVSPASMLQTGLHTGQQQHSGLARVTQLGRSAALQHLDLESAGVELQQQHQQQRQELQHRRSASRDGFIVNDAEAGDRGDCASGLLPPLTSTQVLGHTGSGTGQGASQIQQQQGPTLSTSQQGHQQQQISIPPSELPHISRRLIYQLHDRVHWLDPYSRSAFSGQIMTVESCEGEGYLGRRYILDVDAPVKYVEANCEQLLPRVEVGEYVWCKPNMALRAAWSAQTAQTIAQQQRLQQLLAQHTGHNSDVSRWLGSPWIQGCVVGACVHQDPGYAAVPVVEVSLPCGGRCWFPMSLLQLVKETGESSSMAAQKGQRPLAPKQLQMIDDADVLVVSCSVAAAGADAQPDSGGTSVVANEDDGHAATAPSEPAARQQQQQPLTATITAELNAGAIPAGPEVVQPQLQVTQSMPVHAPMSPAAVPQALI